MCFTYGRFLLRENLIRLRCEKIAQDTNNIGVLKLRFEIPKLERKPKI